MDSDFVNLVAGTCDKRLLKLPFEEPSATESQDEHVMLRLDRQKGSLRGENNSLVNLLPTRRARTMSGYVEVFACSIYYP